MQRICCLALLATFILVVGCGKPHPNAGKDDPRRRSKDVVVVADKDLAVNVRFEDRDARPPVEVVPELPAASDEERKEAFLLQAIDLLAEKKYADALEALRNAQKARYTVAVEQEIFKVQAALEREQAAGKAVEDVKSVLQQGKADEAANLAGQALEQFGGGEQAPELTRLKQQADAVVTASADDTNVRFDSLKTEATAHYQKKNYRAALVSMEHALAVKTDELLAERLAEVRVTIKTYDDNLTLAAGLRRDPTRLEEALTYLRKARAAWDTLEVRQQIDEYTLIFERRRDRIAVADFEVRGDVGVPAAGRTIAEELLPYFSPRFDVVERGQLSKLLDELHLESGDLDDNPAARKELGRASRVRYLVVGSVTTIGGVTVNARLIETATGLIVQTARVTAPDVESLIARKLLKQIALILQMNDQQKMDFEAKLAKAVVVVKPVEATPVVRFEPVPELPREDVRPPVIVTHTPAPLPLGNVTIQHFIQLPKVTIVAPPPPVATLVIKDDHKNRLLRLTLELGDNLFRCRRFHEAERHYNLALTLAGPRSEVTLRVETCRKFLPPPPPKVVVVPRPTFVETPRPVVVVTRPVRPRLAVFGFHSDDGPQLVPAAMGDWAADSLSPYLGSNFELIERGVVCWYMGRLNVTMRDLLTDPSARLSLARALNARFFVFGTIRHTASFNVETHLIDAESGARNGTAAIHVKDQSEMKLRMSELVGQMGVQPDQQEQLAKQGKSTEKALEDTRALLDRDPSKAAETARAALKTSPNNVALAAVLAEAERKQKLTAFESQRQKEAKAQADAIVAAQKRQKTLADAANLAREKAAKDAAARSENEQKKQQQQQAVAADRLRVQAKQATTKGDHARAVQLLQSAVSLKGSDEVYRELGEARAAAEKAKQQTAEAEKKNRQAALVVQREAAMKRIDDDRQVRAKADAERKKTQDARDQAQHDVLMKQAQTLFTQKKYAEALAVAQSSHKTKASPDSASLIRQIQDATALAEAEKKGAQEKQRLEEEQKKRLAAEALQKKNQQAYLAALDRGRELVTQKKYAEAIKQYEAAQGLYPTDAAKNGLTAAKQMLDQEQKALVAQKAATEAEQKKGQQLKTLLTDGKAAVDGKNYARAIDLYKQAGKLSPGNVEALAGLSRAERERDAETARVRVETQRQQAFAAQVKAAETALGQGKKAEAANQLREALKLYPNDKKAKDLLVKADSGPPVNEDYKLAMGAGAAAMKKGNHQGALNSYRQALARKPNDPEATKALAEAQRLLKVEQDSKTEAAYQTATRQAKAAEAAKKWAEAIKAYDAALAQKPNDPTATAGKKAATDALKPAPKPLDAKAELALAMQQGTALEKQKKYADAVNAYVRAVKWAADLGGKTELAQAYLGVARNQHAQKNFAEAIAAYNEVLKRDASNAEAKASLTRAKANKQ